MKRLVVFCDLSDLSLVWNLPAMMETYLTISFHVLEIRVPA